MKIIVPIQGKTEEDCLRTVRLLAAHRYFPYVYAIELRYDLLTNRSETLSDFLQEIRKLIGQKKLIFTIRTDRQGGAFPFGKSYFQLNLLAMESGVPDYIDLEVETGEEGRGPWKECIAMVQHLGGKVIASYHDFQKTPSIEEGEEILDRLSSYPVEVVKMAVMPRTKEDVLNAMLSGRRWKDRHGKTELIVMSMGEMGRASRVLGDLSGSAYSFVQVFTASAPGQWEIGEYLSAFGKLRGKNSVAFLGFMGSGKSTLAPRIAALSGKEFFEMDALLEKKFGMPISAFFQKYGEERFRKDDSLPRGRRSFKRGKQKATERAFFHDLPACTTGDGSRAALQGRKCPSTLTRENEQAGHRRNDGGTQCIIRRDGRLYPGRRRENCGGLCRGITAGSTGKRGASPLKKALQRKRARRK